MVIDTGDEKVFFEEVEKALMRHSGVLDVLVVERPNEWFGRDVVAIVQVREGAEDVKPGELRDFAAEASARFKAPRAGGRDVDWAPH